MRQWLDLHIKNKIIPRRAHHSACLVDSTMYVYGGYDPNIGIMADFHSLNLTQNPLAWTTLSENALPGQLKNHQMVSLQQNIYIVGGLQNSLFNTNKTYVFDINTQNWSLLEVQGLPAVDSHVLDVNQIKLQLILFGGFVSEGYSNAIYKLDLFEKKNWECIHNDKSSGPSARAGSSGKILNQKLYIFGGSNGNKKFNDLWTFNLANKQWTSIQLEGYIPDVRSGTSINSYKGKLLFFGGIHNITHERDDFFYFDPETNYIKVIDNNSTHQKTFQDLEMEREQHHHTQNTNEFNDKHSKHVSIKYKTETTDNPHSKSSAYNQPIKKEFSFVKINLNSQRQNPESKSKGNNNIQEMKKKKLLQMKVSMLSEFETNEEEAKKFADQSQILQKMKNSIEQTLVKQQIEQELKQQRIQISLKDLSIAEDKRPCARDGHSCVIYEDLIILFGGDRHQMCLNDLFQRDLQSLI